MSIPASAAGPAPEPQGAGRVWFAQAIRGVACLMVVVAHCGILFVENPKVAATLGQFPPLTDLPRPAYMAFFDFLRDCHLSLGFFGVALFFLTSGFVIPYSLGRNSLGGFFLRRFFRLYPTLWLVQVVIL